jgi:hypothetical protein
MQVTYENGHIVIRVPVTEATAKAAPISQSGKSRMIATTGGFVPVAGAPQGVKVGLNVIGAL